MADIADVVEALVVRPGDTLIVRVDPLTTHEQVDALHKAVRAYFADRCPDVELAVIAAEQIAVYRPN